VKSDERFPSEEKPDDVPNAPFSAIIPRSGRGEQVEVIPMYIHPFVAGVLATLGVEMALLIVCAMLRCGNNDDER
jgi:hypothetical protein